MQKYISYFRSLPFTRILVLVALVVLTTYCATDIVHAQTTPGIATMGKEGLDKIFGYMGNGLGRAFAFGSVLATFVAMFFAISLGDLMDSTYVLDSGMGDTLHLMWSVVRNFVNISFIIILLGVAIMVVLDVGGEKGGTGLLKKFLPTFIIALVAVNFTWFGARVVLSTADMLSTAVFAIPSSVPLVKNHDIRNLYCPGEVTTTDKGGAKVVLPKPESLMDCMKNTDAILGGSGAYKFDTLNNKKEWADKVESAITDVVKLSSNQTWSTNFLQESFDKKNGIFAMLLNVLSISKILDTAATGALSGEKIFIGGLFSFVIAIMMAIIIFALAMGMIIRMVVLWVTIAASPVIALMAVLKEGFGVDGASKFDPMKLFMTHAFLPALVAIPISFGFIMILSGYALDLSQQSIGVDSTLSFNLEHTSSFNMILWLIASILVIWVGTFKMMEVGEYANKAAAGIKGGAESMFKAVSGTLKYAPIIPVMGGQSVSAITSVPQMFHTKMQGISDAGKKRLGDELGLDASASIARNKFDNFSREQSKVSYEHVMEDSTAKKLLMKEGSDYSADRKKFLEGLGVTNIESKDTDTVHGFQEKLKTLGSSVTQKFGKANGQEILRDLNQAAASAPAAGPSDRIQRGDSKLGKIDGNKDERVVNGNSVVINYDGSQYLAVKQGDGSYLKGAVFNEANLKSSVTAALQTVKRTPTDAAAQTQAGNALTEYFKGVALADRQREFDALKAAAGITATDAAADAEAKKIFDQAKDK